MPKRKNRTSCKTEKRKKAKEEQQVITKEKPTEVKYFPDGNILEQKEESSQIVESPNEENNLNGQKNVTTCDDVTEKENNSNHEIESVRNRELEVDEKKLNVANSHPIKIFKEENDRNQEARVNLDATDSQLCNIDEESSLLKTHKEYEKPNLGIPVGSEKVKQILGQLSTMNRMIMEAKKDLASMRLKMNHALKSSK